MLLELRGIHAVKTGWLATRRVGPRGSTHHMVRGSRASHQPRPRRLGVCAATTTM